MRISLNNAVLATSEYLSHTFSGMKPSLANGIAAVFAHYKLQTQGNKMLQTLADEEGYNFSDNESYEYPLWGADGDIYE